MKIKIACWSDPHQTHKNIIIPECDISLCGGDISHTGTKEEVIDFLDWYALQFQITHRVMIPGNHDLSFDPNKGYAGLRPQWLNDALDRYPNVHCLIHQEFMSHGLKIFGSPYTPEFFPEYWAFNRKRGNQIAQEWAKIPEDTDILVVHGPAKYHLDWTNPSRYDSLYPSGNVGCEDLLKRLEELPQLKLVLVGHIHGNFGIKDLHFNGRTVKYVNGALVDNANRLKHQPIVVDIEL